MSEASKLIPKLYEILSAGDIDDIREYLKESRSDGLAYKEFRDFLARRDVNFDDSDFERLCLKIDMDRDSRIKFHEFITFFIAEYQHDGNAAEKFSLIPPISGEPRVVSTSLRSGVVRVLFLSQNASYMTVGERGIAHIWSTRWKLQRVIRFVQLPNTTASTVIERETTEGSKMLITDAVLMMNVDIICVASSCCDLRFHDIAKRSHNTLRLYIRSFPSPLHAFHYRAACHDDDGKFSGRLIFGDFEGSVRVIDFTKHFAEHFRSDTVIRQISYQELVKGRFATMQCREFLGIHSDLIRQVFYSARGNFIVSAVESVQGRHRFYRPGVIITSLGVGAARTAFKMHSGTTCFAFDESSQTLATGGPDCLVRLWYPYKANAPRAILRGHMAGIKHIFITDSGRLYTIDKLNIIKVWDIEDETLLQTFAGLQQIFPKDSAVLVSYNEVERELLAATKKMAIIKCNPHIRPDKADGITHMTPITLVLLNELFYFLVTCSSDSTVIVWDVWSGHKVNWIVRAHTTMRRGRHEPLEICAGCFDTLHQFLLTAAVDGSVKIWNLNDVVCVRNLSVGSAVVGAFWTRHRILIVDGEVITEFSDNNDFKQQINCGGVWQRVHTGTIVCVSMRTREPGFIATSCSHGDLVFWESDTGTPFLRFNLSHPQRLMQIVFRSNFNKTSDEIESPRDAAGERLKRPTACCMLTLSNRAENESNGTLLVALSNGRIQVWSHHHESQSCIADFNATHVPGDVVTAMTTDTENCYLFTGSTRGYIKAWMIVNLCHSTARETAVSLVKLRARFPFLWRDAFEGRAKRAVRDQQQPLLVNSFQGHRDAPVSGLIYSEKNQILISSSGDKSVRLWDLSGKYINTLGGHVNWQMLSPNEPLPPDFAYRIPADLRSAVSFTTLKVLEGGCNIPSLARRVVDEQIASDEESEGSETSEASSTESIGEGADAELLAKILSRPDVKPKDEQERKVVYEKPTLDISLPHIPIYGHLHIHGTTTIELPACIMSCLSPDEMQDLKATLQLEPRSVE